MLHRALASLLCALGAAALGLGIASATVWRPSDTLVAQAQGAPGTSLLVTDPGVLDLAADEVTVRASATSGTVVIALGRSADVDAWVGDDAYTRVTGLAGWQVLATEQVAGSASEAGDPAADAAGDPAADPAATPDPAAVPDPAAEDPAAEDPAAAAAPDPAGSDLWVDEASGERAATLELTRLDGRWSVLVASTAGGVPSVALEWPQVVTTPWLVPGVVVGSLLLLIGIAWWVLILVAGRRRARAAAAPVPEPAALAPAEPALPLTRRQMRELEEQRSRHKPHDREAVLSRFPTLVPGPKAPDEGQEGRERRGRHGGGEADRHGSDDVSAPQAVAVAPPPGERTRGRHGAAAPTASASEQSHSRRSEQTRGAPASGRTAGGLLGRLRRRPADTPAPAPSAPVEPVGVAPTPPLFTTQRAGTPAASADAWRRAWGLTGADSTQGPVTTAATPTEEPPQAPPRRRRPDGSER